MPALRCTACQALLPIELADQPDLAPCPNCGQWLQVKVFPAMIRPLAPVNAGERVMIDGESSCFYHPQKKAVVPCASCGRFLCALCDMDFIGQHLCPTCLETGKKKGKIINLQNERVRYDRMALSTAVMPLLIFPLWFITPVTGGIAIFLSVRHWNSPLSIVGGNKASYVIAAVLGALQIVTGVLLYYYLFSQS